MKLKSLLFFIIIIILLYLYEPIQSYPVFIDYSDKTIILSYNNNCVYFNNKIKLNIGDTLSNDLNDFKIININKCENKVNEISAQLNKPFSGNKLVYINGTKMNIPINVGNIHTIYIKDGKMIPLQIFVKKNDLIKWKNKDIQTHFIICDSIKGKQQFYSPELSRDDIHTHIFTDIGVYNVFLKDSNDYNINSIIVQ